MSIIRDQTYFDVTALKQLKEKYLRPGMRIADIGTNIGNHSLFFAHECQASHLWQFEPQKDIFRILQKNMELNHLSGICESYNVGLGAKDGNAAISAYNKDNTGGTSIRMDEDGGIEVRCLDDYKLTDVDFLKIDVEGFEYNVLLGAERTLQQNHPTLYIEIWQKNFDKVNALLGNMAITWQSGWVTLIIYIKKYEFGIYSKNEYLHLSRLG